MHPGILNSELQLGNYVVYRKDRHVSNHDFSRVLNGGGVLIAVNSRIMSKELKMVDSNTSMDFLIIELDLRSNKWIICLSYFPPTSSLQNYLDYFNIIDSLQEKYNNHKFMICGDFNLANAKWINVEDGLDLKIQKGCSPVNNLSSSSLNNLCSLLGLEQLYPDHPKKNYTLDLMFTSVGYVRYLHSQDALVPFDFNHHESATFLLSNQGSCTQQSTHISRFNFNKMNKVVLDYCLNSVNWVELLDINLFGIETCIKIFYECLQELFALTIPRFKTNRSFPSYFSIELINNIIKKKRLHARWKNTRDQDIYIEFKKLELSV